MHWLSSSLILSSLHLASATLQIVPGAAWIASVTNQHVQAHGGGIIKEGNTFYWIGENKSEGTAFQSVNCYSSKNLVEWTYVGALLTRQSGGDLGPNRIVERPKVIYNSVSKQYVLYMHIDDWNYAEAKVGVATSSSVCGNYNYRGSFRPGGLDSRDMTVYKDTDGKAYLITEQRGHGLTIYKLSDDYLSVDSLVHRWAETYESPAVIKSSSGVYFTFGSGLTYWNPNDNVYSTSKSLSGPWSSWKTFAPSGSNTFGSQTTFVLPVGKDKFMYMGDRWDGDNLMRSTYIWLPLEISGTTASMPDNYASWVIDLGSGSMVPAPDKKWYEGTPIVSVFYANDAGHVECSGGSAAGYLGGVEKGTLTFNNIMSVSNLRTTIRIRAPNGDRTPRNTTVTINGVSRVVPFLPSDNGNVPGTVALNVDFKRGNNTIVISGFQGGYAADIDAIVVSE
ncbi:hypothetical protein FS749_007233 [Ceratobasidium sp. UAMH 11750]|nr:hypothetical protein FS749_007233 [Ceratobasidium sp. UAMH 11750]